jgi:acetylornithine deacetylase/succinyl-diaminopimelate desuccinylase-like protein
MTSSSPAVAYARQNRPRFLKELKDLLRIPSVSTMPEHKADCRRAAEAIKAELTRIGMEHARLIETDSNPLVYADWLHAGGKPGVPADRSSSAGWKPTALLYTHYDVQPSDPDEEWISPPFEPTERNGNLHARGADDDKGQLWLQVKGLESLLAANGKLPINVRVLFEGDEEVGGEGIASYVASQPADLKADFALDSDTELFAPGLPTLCVGLRGMIYTELEVRGAKTDLHSGMYGGAAPNPFISLAQMLSRLKDENGHILIPGFYDGIVPPSPEELKAWRSLPFDEEEYRIAEVGSRQLVGEAGFSVLERTWARPTLEVHGIPGGFIGAGAKTVIPAKAVAKVSMRLVPGQTPENSFALYKSFVQQITPPGVEVEVRLISAGAPCLIPVDNPYVKAATTALREVWGKETVFIRSGGSIPIVGDFDHYLGMPSVMMGFGLPDDNIHAPNEKFALKNFELGVESIVRFLEEAGK